MNFKEGDIVLALSSDPYGLFANRLYTIISVEFFDKLIRTEETGYWHATYKFKKLENNKINRKLYPDIFEETND